MTTISPVAAFAKPDADVGADQQPAGVGGGILASRLAEQHAGADREQLGR